MAMPETKNEPKNGEKLPIIKPIIPLINNILSS